jgi:hypothetical protein
MLELIHSNPLAVKWVVTISLITFIGTIIVVPYLITLIPEDYFAHEKREAWGFTGHHPLIRACLIIMKNLCGYVLILLGIAMLVLPGQGLLTIIMGLVLIDFPNKYQAERWLAGRPRVMKTMNWLRHRAGKGPLRFNGRLETTL